MKSMNKYQRRWIKFLRQPERRKVTGQLERIATDGLENPRCCLGHACALFQDEISSCPGQRAPNTKKMIMYGGEKRTLPKEICNILKINHLGCFKKGIKIGRYKRNFYSISEVNDQTKLSPAQIADVIEAQFKADNFRQYY